MFPFSLSLSLFNLCAKLKSSSETLSSVSWPSEVPGLSSWAAEWRVWVPVPSSGILGKWLGPLVIKSITCRLVVQVGSYHHYQLQGNQKFFLGPPFSPCSPVKRSPASWPALLPARASPLQHRSLHVNHLSTTPCKLPYLNFSFGSCFQKLTNHLKMKLCFGINTRNKCNMWLL